MIWQSLQEAYGNTHQPRRVKQVMDAASEHGVDQAWAIGRRITFLIERKRELTGMIGWLIMSGSDDQYLLADVIIKLTQKRMALTKEIGKMSRYKEPVKKGGITDEMIAQAKEYPVDQLIDFNNGKAMAWCHDDSNPSLTLWKKGNKAVCWPCDKKFNAIDICMERDGMTFIDAVKYLCRS